MKDKTRTVTIGRRSTQARHSRASTHDTALFRCPVISRRHAQITFLEDGTVSVKDLNSHHGTQVRKPIQISSTPVLPNDPRPLENMDIITFGKIVGRDETFVRPMVAKVRMHYALSPASSPAFATPLSTISGPGPAQSTTGRYGLVAPSALSDSSDSEDDSDVEEIPARSSDAAQASYSNHFPLFSPMPPMQMPRPSGFGLFNNYFSSRAYSPSHAPQVEEQDDNDEEGVVEEVRTPSNRLSPIEVSSASPSRSPSVVEIQAPSQSQEQGQAADVVTGEWSSPSSSPEPQHGQDRESLEYEEPSLQLPADPIAYESDFWHYQHLVNSQIHFQNPSTSAAVLPGLSPCEPHNAVNEMRHYALVNATAPDLSRYDNLPEPRQSPEAEREQSPEDMQLSDDEDGAPQLVPAAQVETNRAPEPIEEQVEESSQSSADVAPERQPEFTPTPELAQGGIETRIEQLKTTIAELGERMSQDSANVNAPQALSDTSGDAAQSQPEPERKPENRVQPEAQGASSTELVVDVQNVVQELRAEQETLKARFAEAAELVKQVKSLVVVQQNCETPLKRKRDELTVVDDDGNDADERYRARPLKRRRSLAVRVASGVAKTTAIAALGAVATWSALAFS
ncbi:hypothetical protein BC629DRAFT_580419 [Irpex lacteus]|nr:hypothetical protein BC629DRAFT_580419 [Irpex lacteus]